MAKPILFEWLNAKPHGSKCESSEISILYWYHSLAYYTIAINESLLVAGHISQMNCTKYDFIAGLDYANRKTC